MLFYSLLWLNKNEKERERERAELNDDYKMARASFQRRQGTPCRQAHDCRKLNDGESYAVQLIYCLCQPNDNRDCAAKKRDRCLVMFIAHGIPAGFCAIWTAFMNDFAFNLMVRISRSWIMYVKSIIREGKRALQCFFKTIDIVCSCTTESYSERFLLLHNVHSIENRNTK